jgi:hypothetical protein
MTARCPNCDAELSEGGHGATGATERLPDHQV